ncbi:hypothetical protein PPROV_000675900 [Pycnococcus provasolii]|uniref:Uncharacterized protein n=1 Tax=Pycnococcus provasolii TaxID=41880 RepID=A0A830HST7_9CHLO|nr:hypothetical protein PPROV_000675900 [Pycnococcus provasolii]
MAPSRQPQLPEAVGYGISHMNSQHHHHRLNSSRGEISALGRNHGGGGGNNVLSDLSVVIAQRSQAAILHAEALQVIKRAIICLANTAMCWESKELFADVDATLRSTDDLLTADADSSAGEGTRAERENVRRWLALPTEQFTQQTPRTLAAPAVMWVLVDTLASLP